MSRRPRPEDSGGLAGEPSAGDRWLDELESRVAQLEAKVEALETAVKP